MATGRIGVTPVLGTRWSIEPAAGTTSLSGLDANSVSLVYSVGYEQVYRNGVLLSRGNDYTATSGTSITLTDATIAGDIIEVFAQELVPLTDAISKGQFTAKGSLLSASAASTPAVLAVGTNGQVLKADSSTTTGLAWGADTNGMTLLDTVTMSGVSSASFQNISGSYKHLLFLFNGFNPATNNVYLNGRLNNDSGSNYAVSTINANPGAATVEATGTGTFLTYMNPQTADSALIPGANSTGGNWQVHGYGSLWIWNYTDTAKIHYEWRSYGYDASFDYNVIGVGVYNASAAITRADFTTSTGNANCRIRLYGVA